MSTIERIAALTSSSSPVLDVVFLHGLDGDPVKTWSRDTLDSFWPQWLAEDNPQAAVWCVGYDAYATKWRGTAMGILDRGVNLLELLQTCGIGERSLCLIGHSLGGLLAKQILVQASLTSSRYQQVARHAKGVIFIGTPHDGASIARIVAAFKIVRPTELLGDLIRDHAMLRHLSTSYRSWATDHGVQHLAFFETHSHPRLRTLIVPKSSADPALPGLEPIPVDADHTLICKPDGRRSLVYASVNRFVAGLVGRSMSGKWLTQGAGLPVASPVNEEGTLLEKHQRVFQASGWSDTLRRLYPRYELLDFMGVEFPIWVKEAAPEHRGDLDIALGELSAGEDPRHPTYPERFDPAGEHIYWDKLEHVDETSSFNGATYALDQIGIDRGKITINTKHGTYFHSLATSEVLERELVDQLDADPDREVQLDRLPRRRWLHEVANGQHVVLDGRRRAAALSVAATFLMAEPDGTFSAMLVRRSQRVETHRQLFHVAPSGIFAPMNAERRDVEEEFSIRTCIMREYGEELFGYKDLEQGDGLLARDVMALPPIRELCEAEQAGIVALRYCGIAVPLLSLRPEIYVLIFVRDGAWLEQEIQRANASDHWFELNWEYEETRSLDAVKLRLDPDLRPVDLSGMHPSRMVPHAAAALHLSTAVARHLLRS